jgi:hypothetical protein
MKPFPSSILAILALLFLLSAGAILLFGYPKYGSSPQTQTTTASSTSQRTMPPDVTTTSSNPSYVSTTPSDSAAATSVAPHITHLSTPLLDALSRITKKPFGIVITKENSPVQPERFSGYHTGVDFETTPEEQAKDVSVDAVCDGKLLMKKWATGYGGVAVQSCTIDGKAVTVIYGHLRLASIQPKAGDAMSAGKPFAVLGTGYSTETDGERKHLHLGIHLGSSVNILGYVQTKSALSQWLDAASFLK